MGLHQDLLPSLSKSAGAAGLSEATLEAWRTRARAEMERLEDERKGGGLELLTIVRETADIEAARPVAAALLEDTTDLVVLGVGGSSLGAQAIAQVTGRLTPGYIPATGAPRFHFFDNLDGTTYGRALGEMDLRTTRFLVVSKSGTTGETLLQLLAAVKAIEDKGGAKYLARHFAILSEPKDNALRKFARETGCLTADHPLGIGGRYSVLSLVGLLPAMLMGLEPHAIRAGAVEVLDTLKAGDPTHCPPADAAALFAAMMETKDLRQIVLWPYADRLERFALWWRQLWGESIGKDGKGSTPIPAIGPVDQHSQLQLYLEGPNDKHVTVLSAPQKGIGPAAHPDWAQKLGAAYLAGKTPGDLVAAQALATADTLQKRGRPVRRMRIDAIDARHLGALFMHFMLETIIACRLLGVDPFDQPAVEEGKVLARQYLAEGRA
ncbi:MAG: glucose-6-phosphate isomerase [Alphaproteobacteria bacterium]|nr:glucose-6-phosphate isomerase [Alphaproteobacteria bacterium]